MIYTTNHPSGNSHGGTAVIIKENIKHYPLEEYKTDKIQATSVKIQDNGTETTLSAIYCPPRHCITTNDFTTYFGSLGTRYICGGDWNAKHVYWGSRLTSPRGRQLYATINNLGLCCASHGAPTYWPADPLKIPDLLDFFIIKNIPMSQLDVEECTDMSSDHTPVIINYHCKAVLNDYLKRLYNRNTNWDIYRAIVLKSINLNLPLKDADSVEATIESFNKTIHTAIHESTPLLKPKTTHNTYYSKFIKDKVSERRQLRKRWQHTKYPSDKKAFNRASEDLKKMICKADNERIQNQMARLTPHKDTNYSLWKMTKNFKRPKIHIPPIKTTNGRWARTELEKSQAYTEHLKTVFLPLPNKYPNHDKEVYEYLKTPLQMCLPLKCATPREVWEEIAKLNDEKTPGYDLIDAKLLKQLPRKAVIFVTTIFNACLKLSIFPAHWKIAQVIMVPKPGKPPHETSSYRPISLLPVMGKLLERILLNRMRIYLKDVIPPHQFGFREKHGTIEQIHRITDTISRTLENKQYCSAIFLDISQAFDRVWHEGLLYKIKKLLPHSFYLILNSYISDRCFEVRYNAEVGALNKILSGVPQGSILGPVLYLLFTADMPTNADTITATYADDTALLSVDENHIAASAKLQAHVYEMEEWLDKWRIKVNQGKSVHVTFTLKRQTCPPIKLHNENIPQADDAKYLGMHLDRRLTWRKHIWTKRKQLDTKLRSMYWLIGRKSHLSHESKVAIYKAIFKPIWTYGIQLWGTASNSNIEILERFQSKILRAMLNIPLYVSNKYIQQDLEINTVKQELTKHSKIYQKRISIHANELASKLEGTGSVTHSRLKRFSVPTLNERFQ